MTGPPVLRIGVVGAGGFATFLARAVYDVPDIRFTAVADADPERAARLSAALAARSLADWRPLIEVDDVDAVVIATPPATHAEIALAALRAGRHVFCEKPLAIGADAAADIAAAVTASGRTLVVDHVLRYNPILRALGRLRGPLLGPVRRLAFENDASDEDLGPDHWFWDERISGGIFVEHGVHFFDAAHALIGSPPARTAPSTSDTEQPGRVAPPAPAHTSPDGGARHETSIAAAGRQPRPDHSATDVGTR